MNSTPAWLHVVTYRLGQVRQQLGFVAPLSAEDKQEVQHWLPTSALALFDTMSNADQQHSLRVCRGLQAQGCIERDMLAAALLHDVGKAQGRVPFWTRPTIVLGKLCAPRLLARVVIPLPQVRQSLTRSEPLGRGAMNCALPSGSERVRDCALPNGSERASHNDICTVPSGDYAHPRGVGRNSLRPYTTGMGVMSYVPTWRRALSYAWWHAQIGADLAANAGLSERAVLYIRTHHEPNGPAAAMHRVDEVS